MSKIIASAAIRGAHKIVGEADKKWRAAMDKWGANEPVGFPNTAYYLPVIYGILGILMIILLFVEMFKPSKGIKYVINFFIGLVVIAFIFLNGRVSNEMVYFRTCTLE